MNHIAIFANGHISSASISLSPNQIILAADGGARHCIKLGIKPQAVIGDFDSLLDEEINALEADHITLIRHPKDKDETDLELALDYAIRELDAQKITLYGLLGGRWDMTFANILLLAAPRYAGIKFQVIDKNTTAYILRGGETLDIQGQPGTNVSVIPLNTPATGVTYQGLQWPLENTTLHYGTPKGVSNFMTATQAKISLQKGILLVFIIGSVA